MAPQSKPRRHHYVPQFFLKAWDVTGNPDKAKLIAQKPDGSIFQTSTENLFHERDLYSLDDEIESEFITPYIDGLSGSIQEIRRKSWEILSNSDKEKVLKFLLLLDARNPISLKDMVKGATPYVESLKKRFENELNDDFVQALIKGAENGVLILVLTAIDEVGLDDFTKSKNKAEIFKKLKQLIEYCKQKSKWPKRYIDNIMGKKTHFFEFTTENKELLSCSSPLYLHGKYDSDFSMAINISPTKALFISNEEYLIEIYQQQLKTNEEKIMFFNDLVKNKSNTIHDMNIELEKNKEKYRFNNFLILNK